MVTIARRRGGEGEGEGAMGRGSEGKIKRTGVRWLRSVAKSCLHIGFCTLRRRLNGTPRGGPASLLEISFFISILQARAPAMCLDERLCRLFATLRVDAI